MNTQPFLDLPQRLFLDSSTLQVLNTYGEFIYDGGSIDTQDRIWSIPDGPENVQADIMFVGQRASWELVLSANSLKEVSEGQDTSYLQWAFEVMYYWESRMAIEIMGSQPLRVMVCKQQQHWSLQYSDI